MFPAQSLRALGRDASGRTRMQTCAHQEIAGCAQSQMVTLADRYQCLACGLTTGMDGTAYTNPGPHDALEIAPQSLPE